MDIQMAEDDIGRTPQSETTADKASNGPDTTKVFPEVLPPGGHAGQASTSAGPAIPSDQLQTGLAKQSRLPDWTKPTLWIGRGQIKPIDEIASDTNGPPTARRILDWLIGLLERTEDAVDYLRANQGRMPNKADPIAMAASEEAEPLRRALDEQLEAGMSRSDLAKSTITKRTQFCAAIGGLFALPGTVPGIGTAAQFLLGMAATLPELDLIRYQMWCLQVELLHLYGMTYSEADANLLREGALNYDWINKGGEAFASKLLTRLNQSGLAAIGSLDGFLMRLGASTALRESARRILAKALPLGIGVAVGTTVNYLKLHLFARKQLGQMSVTFD